MEKAYWPVLLGVILLYFELFLGRICRWRREWFLRWLADAAYKLPNLATTIALLFIPGEHSAAVWIMYVTALSNSMTVYDRENCPLFWWTLFNFGIFVFRALLTVQNSALHGVDRYLAYGFVGAMVFASACCKISIVRARASHRYSQDIANHMSENRVSDNSNAFTLEGYRYVVNWKPLITVHDIYTQNRIKLSLPGQGELWRRTNLCFSFALFRLLFRQYHGLPCDEASSKKTLAVVLDGLLRMEEAGEKYTRGFGIVEVELGFLHDHIHGNYVLWSRAHRCIYRAFAVLKALLMYIGTPVLYSTSQGLVHASGPFILLLLLHFFLDVLGIIFYYRSDKWMVSYMCCRNENQYKNSFRNIIARMNRFKLGCWDDYWQNSIGQYSLLEGTTTNSFTCSGTLFSQDDWFSHSARESDPVRLPSSLKVSIVRVLRGCNGKPLDGVPLLQLASLEEKHGANSRKIIAILKWHIATSYFEMELRNRDLLAKLENNDPYKVASALSRYCAYLVAFRPELLPQDISHTKRTFWKVHNEVTCRMESISDQVGLRYLVLRLRRARAGLEELEQTVTLNDGLEAGELLISMLQNHTLQQLCRILENIWVKLILSIAPQNSKAGAENHAKYLAQGGEFLTHLWAMLSNAGILEQETWPQEDHVYNEDNRFMDELLTKYLN